MKMSDGFVVTDDTMLANTSGSPPPPPITHYRPLHLSPPCA